ncbi:MAG: cytochrome-c oxidase, cbb3-type subunit I [Rhodospirillales bacterium]|nr:cytochrome-c oxidase, cbb3-type subunit I [Rhodospirillales bacterium]
MSEHVLPARPVVYNDAVVKKFVIACLVWAIVAFLAGVYIASELAWPQLNIAPYLNFGRLRPVHTSAAIFAFGGSALIGTSFYVVQRTCRARLWGGEALANFVFWGYQIFIVLAASSYLLGFSKSREYAEPEWHLDLLLVLVWVCYLLIYLGTLMRRAEPHIYVANWFYLGFIITIAMLVIVNNLGIPISPYSAKSYSWFSGVQDAMVQWWYGHNAVGFFLTVPFLGMMYYFIPKAANRPIYSYRLSIVHFWALIFIYIWAGPHHLLWTALPDWTQTLGMAFSIMLWMPSWGGMINGLMTLSGAWDKLRTDPGLRFSVTAVGFYGMSTFEGPAMSIRSVNALVHYSDWVIGHVHSGTLGWVAFITFGALYYLVPNLWGRKGLYSVRLAAWHYWIGTLGIVFYIASMWVAGLMEGLMWRAYDRFGFLKYSFVQVVVAEHPFMVLRMIGGVLFTIGAILMIYNLWMTVRSPATEAPRAELLPAGLPAGAVVAGE